MPAKSVRWSANASFSVELTVFPLGQEINHQSLESIWCSKTAMVALYRANSFVVKDLTDPPRCDVLERSTVEHLPGGRELDSASNHEHENIRAAMRAAVSKSLTTRHRPALRHIRVRVEQKSRRCFGDVSKMTFWVPVPQALPVSPS
jgi:hypothetical protein